MTIAKQVADDIFVSKEKSGVGCSNGIDDQLYSSAKRLLLQKIEFVNAKNSYSININKLKSKYTVLNAKSSALSTGACSKNSNSTALTPENDGIPNPRTVLFMGNKLELTWKKAMRAGAGLSNLGNTCFLNSALQCLTYTPPLANYLISCNHVAMCKMNGQFCMMCALQNHVQQTFRNVGQAIRPMSIIKNLRLIAKHLHFGRQEDAHEFIRYSIDAMQKSCLFGHSSKLDIHTKATTLVYQIFGGYLRSRIKCMQCKAVSDTFDPFLDISLDINKQGCNDLRRCFEQFVKPDILQGNNSYKCAGCKNSVSATKRFSIHRASNVLTIQLKRFSSYMGNKVNREVSYPSKLNLMPYMSAQQSGNLWYELYAVLVHSGFSCQSGHYYAYAKAPNGQWYCLNDSSVNQVGINQVLSQQAYLLFYHKTSPSKTLNGIVKAKAAGLQNNTPTKIIDIQVKPTYQKSTNSNNNNKFKQCNGVASLKNTSAIDKSKETNCLSYAVPVKNKAVVLKITDHKDKIASSKILTAKKENHSKNSTLTVVEPAKEINSNDKVIQQQAKDQPKLKMDATVVTKKTEQVELKKPKISFKLNHTPILPNKQWQRHNQQKNGLRKSFTGSSPGGRKRGNSDDRSISSNESRRSDKVKDSYLKKLKRLKQKLNEPIESETVSEPKAKIQKIKASSPSNEKEITKAGSLNGIVVSTQRWDQKYASHNNQKSKLANNSHVLASLLHHSAGNGYGSSGGIKTWGGENSWVQEDAKRDVTERMHAMKDDWDKEYDRGKKKKVKKTFPQKHHDHSNLFQFYQNTKIKNR